MSIIKAIQAQLGLSVTPANNFTLDASADNGTMKLARGNAGAATQDIFTVGADGVLTAPQGIVTNRYVVRPVQTASGTSVDFLTIPDWVQRITLTYDEISGSSTGLPQVRLRASGAPVTSGYGGTTSTFGVSSVSSTYSTSGLLLAATASDTSISSGTVVIERHSGTTYLMGVSGSGSSALGGFHGSFRVVLPSTLDGVSLVMPSGTFDSGTVLVKYEG